MTFVPSSAGKDGSGQGHGGNILPLRRVGSPDGRPAPAGARHNLPHLASCFIGRRQEVVEVGCLLAEARLVTLTGAAGMGKTRLGLEAAGRVAARYPDGVRLVELASLVDPSGLVGTVAGGLPTDPLDQPPSVEDLAGRIGDRRMLLLLDSCEHLLPECASLVEELVRSCPALDVLATSRQPLGLAGERTWTVGPLSLPDPDEVTSGSLAATEASELFLRRATEANPSFRLTDATAATVAAICCRLDGIPLAIELAAWRVTSLAPGDILDRLDDRFRLLTTSSATFPPRHQTLLGALEWSHDLLSPPEAALLRRLSVFAGWTLPAAEAVCAGGALPESDVVDHLAALVGKSLVVVEAHGEGVRYQLLETVCVWADAKLEAVAESAAVHRAHASWCVDLAERADRELVGRDPQPCLDALDVEHDNLRVALNWARAAGEVEIGLRLVAALARFWRLRGHLDEAQRWLEWAVIASADSPAPLQAKALRAAGLLRGLLGDLTHALPLLEQSSALYAEAGDHQASLCACRPTFLMTRDPRQALPLLEERAASCRRIGDTDGLAHIVHSIGQVHFILGAMEEARTCFQECMQLGRGAADTEALRSGLLGLARVDLLLGDLIRAEGWAAEARVVAEQAKDFDDLAIALGYLGDVARTRGQQDKARRLLTESLRLAHEGGMPMGVARSLLFLARLAQSEGDEEAGALYDRALAVAKAGEAPVFHEIRCYLGMGLAATAGGDLATASGRLLEALEMAQGVGDVAASADALQGLSIVARRQDDAGEASILGHRALELHHRVGARPGIASCLEWLAGLTVDGRSDVAVRLFAAAQALRDPDGLARSRPEQARYEEDLTRIRSGLSAEAFEAAWVEGSVLSADEAVAYALRGRRSQDRPATGWDSLTSAEKEVVRLVSQGLSNPEVGRRLFISPRTVGHHLTHVYDKLGIRSRGALTKELAGRKL